MMKNTKMLTIGAGVLIGFGIGMLYKVLTEKPCEEQLPKRLQPEEQQGPVVQSPELLEV